MPSNAAPTLYAIAFELGVYVVALVVLVTLWRRGRRSEIPLMLAAMVFAGALELSDIKTTHSYYYARFMLMIGTQPDWFPVAIAVAWGLVLHTVMTATARLELPIWLRPPVAALLGVSVDMVLDPTSANARMVSRIGEICDQSGMPPGSAFGVGLWVWCVPQQDPNTIWGIPYANFYAWGVVVLGYTATAIALRAVFGAPRAAWEVLGLAAITGVVAFCLVDTALQLYTPIVMHGVPEWVMLAIVFAPGALLMLGAGLLRVARPLLISTWLFPPSALLYCAGVYVVSGSLMREGLVVLAYVALATLACVGMYIWVLFGAPGFWALLGQYRAARHGSGPAPTRAELLAQGPLRVSQQDLARIAALRDPVLRNYMITQRYHDLSVELARVIAGPNANWCTFATWASKTAGESIRDEEMPQFALDILRDEQRLEKLIDQLGAALTGNVHIVPPNLFDLARDVLAAVSKQVADGNRKVYAELAPLFAGFVACFDKDGKLDSAAFERFMAGLRPGPSASGGQELLRQAFPAYCNASKETDETRRAEWMLLGNCLIGLHEQTRLQPNIAAAINAPVDVTAAEGLFAKLAGLLPGLLPAGLREELERLLGPSGALALRVARAVWQRVATAAAMHISLPDGQRIPLGEDVNVSLGRSFPAALKTLDLAPLRELVARFGADHEAPGGIGATDWAGLDDRMRFIIDMFRTTQQETRLFEQPFAPVELQQLDARYAGTASQAQNASDVTAA